MEIKQDTRITHSAQGGEVFSRSRASAPSLTQTSESHQYTGHTRTVSSASVYFYILLSILLLSTTVVAKGNNHSKTQQAVSTSLELQCPPCDRIHCTPRRAKRLACKGGITKGICNCCPVCAKVEGESCGGAWDYLGKCDQGLMCEPNKDRYNYKVIISNHLGHKPEGICRKVPADQLPEMMQQPVPSYCKPKCSPEYCRMYPKSICSAVDNVDEKQSCQGDCQHTSCSACRFVLEEPSCVKCAKDDFRCLRTFGRCVKQDYCSKQRYPCKKEVKKEQPGSKFRCVVPQCVSP